MVRSLEWVEWYDGFNVLPVNQEKRPLLPWGKWILRRQTDSEKLEMPMGDGLAIICGPVSDHMVCVDFDDEAVLHVDQFLKSIQPEHYWLVKTRSGGRHVWIRSVGATFRSLPTPSGGHVEIRSTGQYAIVPPTPGYEFLHGSPMERPSLIDRDRLMEAYRSITVSESDTMEVGREIQADPPKSRGYAYAAMYDECSIVASTMPGNRNNQLNKSAFKLARFLLDGLLTEDVLIRELLHAARRCGLPEREAIRTIQSAIRGRMRLCNVPGVAQT
jgi:hypothetical protein